MNETLKPSQREARAFGEQILFTSREMNQTLTQADNVGPVFMAHWTNTKTGENGVLNLIAKILADNGSIFPAGAENTESRETIINRSMFTYEVEAEVQRLFTDFTKRYPKATVKAYLGVHGLKAGLFGRIQLSGKEDYSRTSPKPRCKWYLIKKDNQAQ